MKSLSVAALLDSVMELDYQIICGGDFIEERFITSPRVQRPGLALAGELGHLRGGRVELFGNTEILYLNSLDSTVKTSRLVSVASVNRCVFVLSKNNIPPQELIDIALEFQIPVITSPKSTYSTKSILAIFLENYFAASTVKHGVCVEVYGLGVIISGKSGIGKSEWALELIKKGHRLVADDAIELVWQRTGIKASSKKLLQNYIELRGVGIIDVGRMFGYTSICLEKKVDLIIEFLDYDCWNETAGDRSGLSRKEEVVLGVSIPKVVCPVSSGRNMSEIVELVAKDHILREMGYNSSAEFAGIIEQEIRTRSTGVSNE